MIFERIVRFFISSFLISFLGVSDSVVAAAAVPSPPSYAFCASSKLAMMPLNGRPNYSVKSFGARGDGKTDDTKAIQTAMNLLPPSSVLTFPKGTYLYSSMLNFGNNGGIILGQGGVLKATNPEAQAIILKGTRNAIISMIIQGTGTIRSTQPQTTLIWATGSAPQIINNDLSGGASAGIFIYGATDFRVVGNKVTGTLADGIHVTAGARRGIIEGNVVRATGDDMIAVVSYCGPPGTPTGKSLAGDVLIRKNNVAGNTWGRGITVVGGENVSIIENTVADIWGTAGILLAQEWAYNSCGVNGVLVDGNDVQRIQTGGIPKNGVVTHQGGIDVNSSNQRPVQYIQISNNHVKDVGFSGVRLLDDIRHTKIMNNVIEGSVRKMEPPVAVLRGLSPKGEILCAGNTSEGMPLTTLAQCSAADKYRDPWPAFNFAAPQGDIWKPCPAPVAR